MAQSVTVYEISQLIGKEMTQKIIQKFGGKSCYLSTDPMALEFPNRPDKNKYIKNLWYDNAFTIPEIAEKVELSEGHVRKIINKR